MRRNQAIAPMRVLLLILVAAIVWRGIFIFRSVDWITNFWLFEDFGYSLKIARNIASGIGETFDGVIHTSGYQPLYVWIMVPVFWIFPKNLIVPVYVAEVLLAVCNALTAIFIYYIVKCITQIRWAGVAAAAIWAFNLAVARNGSLGLEAGLSTMMVASSVAYAMSIRVDQFTWRNASILGFLLAIAFLSRVDAVFLVAATLAYFIFLGRTSISRRCTFSVIVILTFVILVSPYCGWNLYHYGSPLPTSGQVTTGKSSLFSFATQGATVILNRVVYGLYILGRMLVGLTSINGWVPYSGDLSVITAAITTIVLVGAVGIVFAKYQESRREIVYIALVGGMYVFAYTVYSFVAFERYLLPAVLASVIVLTSAAAAMIRRSSQVEGWRPAVVLAMAFPLACFAFTAKPKILSEETWKFGWHDGAQALNRIAPEGTIVAALQTGNTGYFYEKGRAINLDGVVNLQAYQARVNGTMDKYLAKNHVQYLADEGQWPLKVSDDIKDPNDRATFLASLEQVFATPDYTYTIYRIDTYSYRSIRKLEPTEQWKKTEMKYAIDGYNLMGEQPGATLRFSSDRTVDLRFLRHDWSGIADIYRDGILIEKVDLYAPVLNPAYRVHLPADEGMHSYAVVVDAAANPQSHGKQVWFDAILER